MCQILAVAQRGFSTPRNPHSLKIVATAKYCVLMHCNTFELSRGVLRTRQMRQARRLCRISQPGGGQREARW